MNDARLDRAHATPIDTPADVAAIAPQPGDTDIAVLMLDAGGVVRACSAAVDRCAGRAAPEMLGKPFAALGICAERDSVEAIAHARAHGRSELAGWCNGHAGARMPARVTLDALRDHRGELAGFAVLLRDAGQPANAESTAISDAKFRLLVESVKDYAIFLLTPEGHVASWNAGAQAIKGYAADEILGSHFSRFYEPEAVARGWPQHELALARANGRFEDEGWRVRKDGTRFWANVVITALYAPDGTLRGFAKVTRDLTVRRQVEEFQRTERRMNEFLAMLAHELRNPLAPMRTALDIVERSPDDAKLARFARDVFSRQLGHMTRLVDDLLDVSRITSGKIELRFEAVDLNDVLRDAVDGMRPLFDGQRQSLDVALPSSPTPIRADPTRLLQAATNLLSNAHKYTPPGGRIAVTLRRDGEFAELEVRDNGHGIEASLLPRIFDLFVQGDRHVDRKEGGLGIGLTLVKRLVELHGGTISATSPGAGQGSVFTVRLPMHDPPAATDAHAGRGSAEVSALKVLVVEDVADVANSMAMLLRVLGHTVRTASDGASALERARAFAPDLVLLDIGLPGISGYEVAQALRLMPATRDAMLVACTGYGRAADRERAVEAGFDRHVVKPVGADELMAILSDAAARRSAE